MAWYRPWLGMLAAIALAAVGGCRERQEASAPAVPSTWEAAAQSASVVTPLAMETLRGAKADPALCSLDYVDDVHAQGTLVVDRRRPMRLRGWFGTKGHTPAGEFQAVLASDHAAWAASMATGAPRPDVADYFDALAMGTAGFDRAVDLSPTPPGSYRVVLLSREGDATIACDTDKRLRLP